MKDFGSRNWAQWRPDCLPSYRPRHSRSTSTPAARERRGQSRSIPEHPILKVRKPTSHLSGAKPYPYSIPTLELLAEGRRKLPAHVRLSIVKQAAAFALDMRGDYMLLVIIDWLETEILDIAANPGRLMDLDSTVNAGASDRGGAEGPVAALCIKISATRSSSESFWASTRRQKSSEQPAATSPLAASSGA